MATYVSLVNKAISESGCDLALYQADGSDFDTNTEPMLNRFKTWVARSWQTVQQVAFDWEFLNNQGIVTINPGLMFYTPALIEGELAAEIDFYGTDDSLLFENVPVDGYKDLTYTQYSNTADASFGYVDLTCSGDEPLVNLTFKAGGDYFNLENRVVEYSAGNQTNAFYEYGVLPGHIMSMVVTEDPYGTATHTLVLNASTLMSLDPLTDDVSRGNQGFVFTSESQALLDAIDSGDYQITFYYSASNLAGWSDADPYPVDGRIATSVFDETSALTYELVAAKAYLHSWKSFNFSEEIAEDDYAAELCEINHDSFKLINHEEPSASTTRPLPFVPWSIFSIQYDNLTTAPAMPKFITEDNTGRWRLFPHPQVPITLKFDYNRIPQELVLFDDVPKGLPNDFMELVMWLAIRMYGEYDEQPSVARRAERYYKDLLQRLQIKYRPKFRFQPVRLY